MLTDKQQCPPGEKCSGPGHPEHLAPNALSIVFKTYEHGAYLLTEFLDTKYESVNFFTIRYNEFLFISHRSSKALTGIIRFREFGVINIPHLSAGIGIVERYMEFK